MSFPGGRVAALVVGLALLAAVAPAAACDICALYTASEIREERLGPRVGAAMQYTHFGTLQEDGREVRNPDGERLDSVITQLIGGYTVHRRVTAQLTLPVISRTYRRREGARIAHGDESGVGDLLLSAQVLAFEHLHGRGVFRFSLLGGIEFPTGGTHRLDEEAAPDHHREAAPSGARTGPSAGRTRHAGDGPRHGGAEHGEGVTGAESGVHGHDLALGSGSYDGLAGARVYLSLDRWFMTAQAQYAIRSTGASRYRYANDLTWALEPGFFVFAEDRWSSALVGALTGETKGKDEQLGRTLDDTAVTAVYAGPGLRATWVDRLDATIQVELPVVQHTTARQIVPDIRLRGGLVFRF